MQELTQFLNKSLTAHQAVDNAQALLDANGFIPLVEREDWSLCQGGKYYVKRGASIMAFTVGSPDTFSYKIAAAHLDSPCLKLKENPVKNSENCSTLNVEPYGGGIWYSFFDRPLKIAGRVIKNENGRIYAQNVESPFLVTIPSLAIHLNREANEGFAVNKQIDLLPLIGENLTNEEFIRNICGDNVLSYDLYLACAQDTYAFGVNNEFLASPRIDNLTSAYACLQALISHAESDGICVAALFNREEIGSTGAEGASGDFLEYTLRRIAYALRFDEVEFYKAVASSFFLSVDNAHAKHPNHPEKADPTNKTVLGGGIVIKSHANGAYATDGFSAAILKNIFDKAGVKHQTYFNRSDLRSGSTLGVCALTRLGMQGADIGLAQLAMHSACESFTQCDYAELTNGLTAFYSSHLLWEDDACIVQ
jgi:aspartyl aminopeptidase